MERYTIEDVAHLHGLTGIMSGGNVYCDCPSCGKPAKRKKFSYSIAKNCFSCWSCGVKGNATDLHALLSGQTFSSPKEAAKEIFKLLEGGEAVEFHERAEERKTKFLAAQKEQVERKKTESECSKVYFALLELLKLKKCHAEDLLRRGLSEDDIIAYKFRSLPSLNETKEVCKILSKSYDLEGVPGFYKDKGEWTFFNPSWNGNGGYFCPAYDGRNYQIKGFQIRMDKPLGKKGDTKYLWFSSKDKEAGAAASAIASFLPGKGDSLLIVEGILKAQICYCLLEQKVTIIGIPGVKNIASIREYLEEKKFKRAYEAFDMDQNIRIECEDKKIEAILRYCQKIRTAKCLETNHFDFLVKDDRTLVIYQEGSIKKAIQAFPVVELEKLKKEWEQKARKTLQISEDSDKLKMLVASLGVTVQSLKWNVDNEGIWQGQYKGLDDYILDEGNRRKMLNFLYSI